MAARAAHFSLNEDLRPFRRAVDHRTMLFVDRFPEGTSRGGSPSRGNFRRSGGFASMGLSFLGRRSMCPQETPDFLDRSGFQLRWLAPRKHRDVGVRAERSGFDGRPQAGERAFHPAALESASGRNAQSLRHAVNELGPHAVKVMKITLDLRHVEIGPLREQLRRPVIATSIEHVIRVFADDGRLSGPARLPPRVRVRAPSVSSRSSRRCSCP